jgi:hypothetical protein
MIKWQALDEIFMRKLHYHHQYFELAENGGKMISGNIIDYYGGL